MIIIQITDATKKYDKNKAAGVGLVSRPLDDLWYCYLGFCDDHLSRHPDTRESHVLVWDQTLQETKRNQTL